MGVENFPKLELEREKGLYSGAFFLGTSFLIVA